MTMRPNIPITPFFMCEITPGISSCRRKSRLTRYWVTMRMIVKLPKRMYSIHRTWLAVRLIRLTITPAQAAAMANRRKSISRHQPVIGLLPEETPEKQDREDSGQKKGGRAQAAAAERVDLA